MKFIENFFFLEWFLIEIYVCMLVLPSRESLHDSEGLASSFRRRKSRLGKRQQPNCPCQFYRAREKKKLLHTEIVDGVAERDFRKFLMVEGLMEQLICDGRAVN